MWRDTKNREGMLWSEWLQASALALFDDIGLRGWRSLYAESAVRAFNDGVDPSEFRSTPPNSRQER